MAGAFSIPLRMPFRGVTSRAGLLVRGPAGWGEFSPFPEYGPAMTRWWRAAALEAASTPWPPGRRTSVPVNVTVPACDPADAYEVARSSGCSTAKVKVGTGDDAARVAAVRDALGPDGRIRLDVNGAWSVAEAVAHIRHLAHFDLEYVEQPVASLDDLAAVRRAVDVPVAADEAIRLAPDPFDPALLRALREAADVAILKVQPLGGVWRALHIAEAVGLPAVVSSAVDTSVGIAAGLALACALPELPYACGLATCLLLAGDVVASPLVPVGGEISVTRPPADPAALSRWAAPDPLERGLRARWAAAGTEAA